MGDAQDIEMDGSSEYDEENTSQYNINNHGSKKYENEDHRRGKGSDNYTQNGANRGKKKNAGKILAQENSLQDKTLSVRELKKIKQQIERLEHQPGRTKKKREYHLKQSEKKSPESDHSLEQRKDEKESMSSKVLGSSMGNSGDRFNRKNMMETFQLGSSLSVGASQDPIGHIPELVTSQSSHGGSNSKNKQNGNNNQNSNNNNTDSSIFKTSMPTLTAAASAEGSTKIQIRYQNPDNQPGNSSKNNNLTNGNKSKDTASINNNSNNGMGIIVTEDDSEISASRDHFEEEPCENADEEEDTSLHLISKPTPSFNSKSVLLPTPPNHPLLSQFTGQAGNHENPPVNVNNILIGNLPGCEINPELDSVSGGNPSIAAAGKARKNNLKKNKDSSISATSPVNSTASITAPTAMHLQSSNSQEGSASKIQVICTTNEVKATTSRQPSRSSFSNSNTAASTQVAQPQTVAPIPTHSSPQFQANNGSNSNSAVITLIKQNNQTNNNNHTQQLSPETIQQVHTSNIMLQPTSSSNLIQMRMTNEDPLLGQDKNNPLSDTSANSTKQTPSSISTKTPVGASSNAPNFPSKSSSNNKNSINSSQQSTNPSVTNPSGNVSPSIIQNPVAIPTHHITNSKLIIQPPISIKNPNSISSKPHGIMTLPSAHNMITIPQDQTDPFESGMGFNDNGDNIQPLKKKRKGGRPSSKNDKNNNNKSGHSNTNKSDQLEPKLSREEIPAILNQSKFVSEIVPTVSERAERRKADNEYKERMKKGPLNQNLFSDQPSLFIRLNDYQDDQKRNRLLQAEEMVEKNNSQGQINKKEGQLFSSSSQLLTLQPFLNYLPQQQKIPLVFSLAQNRGQNTEESTIQNQTIGSNQISCKTSMCPSQQNQSNSDLIANLQSKETNGYSSQDKSSRIKKVDFQASLIDQTNVISDIIIKKFKSSNTLEGFNEPFSSLHSDFAGSYLSPEFCKGVLTSFNRHQDFVTEDQNIEY